MNQLESYHFWAGIFNICNAIIQLLIAAACIKYLWS